MTPRTPLEGWICAKIGAPGTELQRAALEAYQLERLNATLALVAARSPFYRRRLAGAPLRLSRLDEIAALPFTTPDDLRADGPEMVCVAQSEIERIVTLDTSGTTGEPKRVYFTRADQELTIDFFQHGMAAFTQPGDRVLVLLPFERPGSVGDLLAAGLQRLGALPVLHGPLRDPQPALAAMSAARVNVLVGAPTHILALAWFSALDGQPAGCRPEQVLLSTDYVPAAVAAALQTIWGCAVYNHYGMTETGLGGGVDCQARCGYHLREADLYYEIIDPDTGQPVPDGQPGEVVFTTLTRSGMPLIRYRSGDISRFLPQPCACGAALKTLAHVHGRYSGTVRLGGGPDSQLAMADLDESLLSIFPLVNFSAVLTGDREHACLELEATLLPGNAIDWRPLAHAALERLPAVQAARRTGRLDLAFREHIYDPATAGSLAKRKIIDRRNLIHA